MYRGLKTARELERVCRLAMAASLTEIVCLDRPSTLFTDSLTIFKILEIICKIGDSLISDDQKYLLGNIFSVPGVDITARFVEILSLE